VTLREYIEVIEHPDTNTKTNDFIFLHNLPKTYHAVQPKSLLWDACENDSGEDEEDTGPMNNYNTGITAMKAENDTFMTEAANGLVDDSIPNLEPINDPMTVNDNFDDDMEGFTGNAMQSAVGKTYEMMEGVVGNTEAAIIGKSIDDTDDPVVRTLEL